MRFHNTREAPLHFEIDGVWYDVEIGGECDIPDAKAFCVKTRKLPLEPSKEQPPKAVPEPSPTTEDDKLLEQLTRPDPPRRARGR